jgi:hypothetical protein
MTTQVHEIFGVKRTVPNHFIDPSFLRAITMQD